MLIPCEIRVVSGASDIRSLWVVYMALDMDHVVQYVGYCPLSELLTLENAYSNSEFAERFSRDNKWIEIRATTLAQHEREAIEEYRKLVRQYNPHCNRKGYYQDTKFQYVKCDQTGETFRSAAECAKMHNLTRSALSNHLRRRPGFKTVKGRTYSHTMIWPDEK